MDIESSSFDFEPPAAGMTEIAFTIIATGTLGLAFKFFEPLVTAAGEAYRDEVLRLLRIGRRSKESDRGYIPLKIALGETSSGPYPHTPVRYYFHGKLDEAELLIRLKAADEHVRTIPPEFFSGLGGPPENGFFWDEEEGRWRGTIWRYPDPCFGEFWLPPNIFGNEDES
jgi:hypothetical protein